MFQILLYFFTMLVTVFFLLPPKALAVNDPSRCSGTPVDLDVQKKLLSFREYSRPGTCGVKPTKIVMHTTWGIEDADGLWNYFETNPDGRAGASTHFVVGKDGKVLQMLELFSDKAEIAWAVAYYNDDSVSIELGHRANYQSKGEAPQSQYTAAIRLVQKLMDIYDIPIGNIEFSVSNSSNKDGTGQIQKSTKGIFGHYQLSPDDRTDPGAQFLRDFREDLKRSSSTPSNPDTSPDEQNSTSPGARIGRSNCVITKVGNPTTSPSPPPECLDGSSTPPGTNPPPNTTPSKGEYTPPIPIGQVGGIATEMAAYVNDYKYDGHAEHAGLDITAAPGRDVFAVADGTVTFVRGACADTTSFSCRFEITHNSGLISSYTHVDIVPGIANGKKVRKGEKIAAVHNWSMPHLHFEFQSQRQKDSVGVGININPRNYIQEYNSVPIDPGYGGNVRAHTNSRGIYWTDDGKEFAETFRNHPPCVELTAADCWAH